MGRKVADRRPPVLAEHYVAGMPLSAALRARAGAALATGAFLVLAACGGGDSPTLAGQAPPATTAPSGTPTTAAGATPTTASGATPTTAAPTTTTTAGVVLSVTVRGGQVVEGASRQRANLNQPVTIRVTSDAADQVHVHGYDEFADVAPGRVGEVTFVANIPGVFEVELEGSHRLLFTMEVR